MMSDVKHPDVMFKQTGSKKKVNVSFSSLNLKDGCKI